MHSLSAFLHLCEWLRVFNSEGNACREDGISPHLQTYYRVRPCPLVHYLPLSLMSICLFHNDVVWFVPSDKPDISHPCHHSLGGEVKLVFSPRLHFCSCEWMTSFSACSQSCRESKVPRLAPLLWLFSKVFIVYFRYLSKCGNISTDTQQTLKNYLFAKTSWIYTKSTCIFPEIFQNRSEKEASFLLLLTLTRQLSHTDLAVVSWSVINWKESHWTFSISKSHTDNDYISNISDKGDVGLHLSGMWYQPK